MLCNVSLQVLPGVPEEQLYQVVDQVIELIQESGVKYVVGPMETTMEGELHQLLGIVEKAQEVCFKNGAAQSWVFPVADRGFGRFDAVPGRKTFLPRTLFR